MKIMSRTSRISIMGVMLISPLGPLPPPTAIAISQKLLKDFLINLQQRIRHQGESRALLTFSLIHTTDVENLLREQTPFVHAAGAKVIDNIFYLLVLGTRISFDINHLAGPAAK